MTIEGITLHKEKLPKHVAFIMDGNRRWAIQKSVASFEGHRRGIMQTVNIVQFCQEIGINVVSLFVFSKENWSRSDDEVQNLFALFHVFYEEYARKLHEYNVKVLCSGDLGVLEDSVRKILVEIVDRTRENTGLIVNLALNYSGQMEILQAVQALLSAAQKSQISPEDVTEEFFSQYLFQPELPFPDLLIRTGGEMRVSNFFLWQLAYTELCFLDILWPDFGKIELLRVLDDYQQRERRFGGDAVEDDK